MSATLTRRPVILAAHEVGATTPITARSSTMPSFSTDADATRERLVPLAYRPKDAAAVLGVSKSTIYQMIAEGRLEARKIGAATVIPRTSLLALFEAAPRTVAQTVE